jgi:hypothetical protein
MGPTKKIGEVRSESMRRFTLRLPIPAFVMEIASANEFTISIDEDVLFSFLTTLRSMMA